MSTELKSITLLLYDFSTVNEKCLLSLLKVFNLPVERSNSKSCKFHATYVFMLMLFVAV